MNIYSKKSLLTAEDNDEMEAGDAGFMMGYIEAF